jgi:hypothetical protein
LGTKSDSKWMNVGGIRRGHGHRGFRPSRRQRTEIICMVSVLLDAPSFFGDRAAEEY